MRENRIIINFLTEKFPSVQGIYLFGSRADGTAQPDSDFDIGVLLPHDEKISGLDKFDLATELGSKLGHDVDLLNLRELYTDIQFQVVAYG